MEIKELENKLKIYKEDDQFVIEEVNELDQATKHYFTSEDGLKKKLDIYYPVIDQYDIEISKDLWSMVVEHLNK